MHPPILLPWAEHDMRGRLWTDIPADYQAALLTLHPQTSYAVALGVVRAMIAADSALYREVYPRPDHLYAALGLCPLSTVRVVILGQDPYIRSEQAHGLALSVLDGRPPQSLRNVYDRILDDTGVPPKDRSGDLRPWASQGVLLLNSIMTVRHKKPNAHRDPAGWPVVTGAIIQYLATQKDNLVFMLWGRTAQILAKAVDPERHLVLRASHPSPLGCRTAAPVPFEKCDHFSKCNDHLGANPIRW